MRDAEPAALPFVLPADFALARVLWRDERWSWREGLSIAAAALLHLALLAWLLMIWRDAALHPPAPEIVPVTVVFAPPPAARPVPAPPPAPPAKPEFKTRESGPDERTTTLPPADEAKPEETRQPAAAAAQAPHEDAALPPPPQAPERLIPEHKPSPKPQGEAARRDPRPEADKSRAKQRSDSQDTDLAFGDRERRGDPYANRLMRLIELHRVYPKVTGQFGLPAEGTAVYEMAVDRGGQLRGLRVSQSSGVPALDEAGAGMLRSAAPFPPLPADFPEGVVITVTLHLFPRP